MVRVLIVDDHPLFREALEGALKTADPKVRTVEAFDISNAVDILSKDKRFDLILLDLNIPDVNGFEGLMKIRGLYPRLPVVVVSGHEDPKVIKEALSHGIAGFIPKSTRKDRLAEAVQLALKGELALPEGYQPIPDDEADSNRRDLISRLGTLTPQQMRVLQMLREGLLNKQIAYELNVGETTVKAHVSEILRKLNVYNRTKAAIEVAQLDAEELLELGMEFQTLRAEAGD